MLIV
ncbi:hypothetical protein FQN60_016687 [Etheostoma spectabile]|jgi:hypothetical protein